MKETLQNKQLIYDVIIAGAGPVGLFLACELALANCSVLLLEKADRTTSPLKKIPFGMRGLSAPTIEAFDRRGLLSQLELHKRLKNPHIITGKESSKQVGHFAGIPFYEDKIDASQWKFRLLSSTVTSLISEIEELEMVLTHRAESLGVTIKHGFPITAFLQNEDEVMVHVNDQIFKSKWLVGCDGSKSLVRKKGGFEFAGTEPEFTGYSVKADILDPEKLSQGRIMTSQGMYILSQPGYILMQDFDGGAFHDAGKPITLEHIQKTLRRISQTDVTINALHIATTWTDRARQATTYRNGRVFLAGDAAHIHSPLGGQGLNLGIGDAMNLGWKLAAIIKKKAPEGLLDSYQAERHPIGAQVLDWSRAQVAIMKPDSQSRALNSIIRDLINTKDGATYFAGKVWGIHTQFNLEGNHALIGKSTPDFELADGTTLGELMHDGKGILLDFEANEWLKNQASEYKNQVKYISAQAKEQLGLNAVLIRPDGIVAWVCISDLDCEELKEVLEKWFGKDY